MIKKLFELFDKEQYDRIYSQITKNQLLIPESFSTYEYLDLTYLKLFALTKLNYDFDILSEIDEILTQDFDSIIKLKFINLQILSFTERGSILQCTPFVYAGDFQLKCIRPLLSKNSETVIAQYIYLKGRIYYFKGEMEIGMDFFKKSLEMREKLSNLNDISQSYNAVGACYERMGDFATARIYLKKAAMINKSTNNLYMLAISLSNLGMNFLGIGDLEEAFSLFEESYDVFKKYYNFTPENGIDIASLLKNTSDQMLVANLFLNLGNTLAKQGKIRSSLEYYKEAQVILIKLNHPFYLSELYSDLISIYLELGDKELVKMNFNSLSNINELETKIVKNRIEYSKALILSYEKSFKGKFKAKKRLRTIINSKTSDKTISIKATILLSELLIEEFIIFEDKKNLMKAKTLIETLNTIAEENRSYILLVESYILKMKFAIIEGDIDNAVTFLDKASLISSEKGLSTLYDKIISERQKMEHMSQLLQNDSLKERLEKIEMKNYMNEMKNFVDLYNMSKTEK